MTKDDTSRMSYGLAFYWSAAWYNGCGEKFDRLISYLESQPKQIEIVSRPDWIKSDGTTPILELLWMMLCMRWGEYGTSPRSGWIYKPDLENCIKELKLMRRFTWGDDLYESN